MIGFSKSFFMHTLALDCRQGHNETEANKETTGNFAPWKCKVQPLRTLTQKFCWRWALGTPNEYVRLVTVTIDAVA